MQNLAKLTPRELDVLRQLRRGLRYREAAEALNVSINTVRTHVRGAFKKLGVHSAHAAAELAVSSGQLEPEQKADAVSSAPKIPSMVPTVPLAPTPRIGHGLPREYYAGRSEPSRPW